MFRPSSPESRERHRPSAEGARRTRTYRVHFDREHWVARDTAWATRLNRATHYRAALLPLAAASRLGDGVLWYALMLSLPFLAGRDGRACATQMAIAGLMCVSLYWVLKRWAARPRPFTVLVAVSRVALGLHYPSDLAAGAMIGAGIGWLVLLSGIGTAWI